MTPRRLILLIFFGIFVIPVIVTVVLLFDSAGRPSGQAVVFGGCVLFLMVFFGAAIGFVFKRNPGLDRPFGQAAIDQKVMLEEVDEFVMELLNDGAAGDSVALRDKISVDLSDELVNSELLPLLRRHGNPCMVQRESHKLAVRERGPVECRAGYNINYDHVAVHAFFHLQKVSEVDPWQVLDWKFTE